MRNARAEGLIRRSTDGHRVSGLVKRSFSLSGHRTSVALEDEFWVALSQIAAEHGRSLSRLVAEVDANRDTARPLASALRVVALRRFFPPPSAR